MNGEICGCGVSCSIICQVSKLAQFEIPIASSLESAMSGIAVIHGSLMLSLSVVLFGAS